MELLAVEALAVAEEPVLTQMLAMVGGDDDQGVVEQAAPFELVKSLPISESTYAMQSS